MSSPATLFLSFPPFTCQMPENKMGAITYNRSNWCGKADLMTISLFGVPVLQAFPYLSEKLAPSLAASDVLHGEIREAYRKLFPTLLRWMNIWKHYNFPQIAFTFFSICERELPSLSSPRAISMTGEARSTSTQHLAAAFLTDIRRKKTMKIEGWKGAKYDRRFDILWLFPMEIFIRINCAIFIVVRRRCRNEGRGSK